MDPITQQGLAGSAGAGGGDPVYVDDVFSIDLYRNDSTTEEFNNGLDMAGEGGLVVTALRDLGADRGWVDSERGVTKAIKSNSTNVEATEAWIDSFDNDGFTHGSYIGTGNNSGLVSWSFRKARGFFDVVKYTGNGVVGRNISHNLGSTPGMFIVKSTTHSEPWAVWHRSLSGSETLRLNESDAKANNNGWFNSTAPTSSVFTVGNATETNANGYSYVAYIFAHDDQRFGTNSDESIIKCGSFTGNTASVDLGFEPQWVMFKRTDSSAGGNWHIYDTMRGFHAPDEDDALLYANVTNAESVTSRRINLTSTGFDQTTNLYSGATYIYMAIRRPNKPPTAGTEVFDVQSRTTTNPNLFSTPLRYVDAAWNKITSGTGNWLSTSRLQGPSKFLRLNTSGSEGSVGSGQVEYDHNYKINPWRWSDNATEVNYLFRRAPGFFDVVNYTGNGADNHQIPHNLGVLPEFALFKSRNSGDSWIEFNDMNASTYTYGFLNGSSRGTQSYGSGYRMFAQPNATSLFLSNYNTTNQSGQTFICYLFASLDGISKVGTYTGTGNDINVDCGFTAGARFVLIKQSINNTGDWYVWDTARGIVSGNDPIIRLNESNAESQGDDYIDPLNAGFTVTSLAPGALNDSGNTYLFLAIA